MQRRILSATLACATLLVIIAGVATTYAQSGGVFDLTWSTLDGGGGASSGGTFTLNGTIGQADAGELTGGALTLGGGFWKKATASRTATSTATASRTATSTATASRTATSTATASRTATSTATVTPTATGTSVATATPTSTPTDCIAKPGKPLLVTPPNGKTVKKQKVFLDWDDVSCADSYKVMVRLGSKKGSKADSAKNLPPSQYTTKTLTRGQTYYWRASACSTIFGCANSAWQSFKIKP